MHWYALIYHTIIRGKQISLVSARLFGCRTTKLLSQMKRHLAIFCISFLWQRGTRLEKKKKLLSQKKRSHLVVFCINRTTIGCYDFVPIQKISKSYRNTVTYRKCPRKTHFSTQWVGGVKNLSTDRHKTLLRNGAVKNLGKNCRRLLLLVPISMSSAKYTKKTWQR